MLFCLECQFANYLEVFNILSTYILKSLNFLFWEGQFM